MKGFDGSVDVLRGNDYSAALDEIDTWMRSEEGMSKDVTADWDAFFKVSSCSFAVDSRISSGSNLILNLHHLKAHADDEPTEILVTGQPWGALEEKRLGKRLAPGLFFTLPKEVHVNPYIYIEF